MPKEIRLPQLGQTMEEGTIVTILIKEGDSIQKGDVIFEVETDKATLEMESPAEGYVKKVLVEAGQTIAVNSVVGVLGDEDEQVTDEYLNSFGVTASPESQPDAVSSPANASTAAKPESANVVRLPQLGQTMEEGTIVTILIKEGNEVSKEDVIFEVETDKATLEMECPADGFVKNVLVSEGQTIQVNAAVAILGDKDEEISQSFIDSLSTVAVEEKVVEAEPVVEVKTEQPKPAAVPAKAGRIFASPRAKKAARELGVDLSRVKAKAGAARIVEQDVINASKTAAPVGSVAAVSVELPEPAYKLGEKVKPSRLQKITGQRMVQSKHDIPCFYLTTEVDATALASYRAELNATGSVKVSFNDFIIKAVATGLKHFPMLTGQLVGDYIQIADKISVGLAISVKDGLVAPLVRDADKKTVAEIASYGKGLIERARANKLGMDDLEGGCVTVSNLGGFGITSFIPIVVPGQCSIIGIGKIADTCVPIDGNIMVRKMMSMTISVDHKVANGVEVAQFLDVVKKLLENPSQL